MGLNCKRAPKWSMQSRPQDSIVDKKRSESVPGPSMYGDPPYENSARYSKAPRACFTRGQREGLENKVQGLRPGVGSYSPLHINLSTLPTAPKTAFPKSSRDDIGPVFHSARCSTPGPGTYTLKTALTQQTTTLTSRPGERASSRPMTPGPGQYNTPRDNLNAGPSWKIGSSLRPSLARSESGSRSGFGSPGPGFYPVFSCFASSHPAISRAPGYSMLPRRVEKLRNADQPGPGAYGGAITTFGY